MFLWKMLSCDEKDSAYSWFVAFSLFLVNCIDDGILKAFGVLLNSLSFQYNVEVWVIGTTVSVMCLFGSITATIVSPLAKRMLPRYFLMICGCLSGLGLLLASSTRCWTRFAINIIILSGIGLRCTGSYIFSYLQIYFDKHYALACGFVCAGRPIGTMVFAPMTQVFLNKYGARGSVFILGAITFHIVLGGAFLKPPRNSHHVYRRVENETSHLTENNGSRCTSGCIQRVLELFEVQLFQKYEVLSIMSTYFAGVFGFQTWIIYLIPHAIEKGLTSYEAIALTSSGAIGQLLGIVVAGLIIDKGVINETKVSLIALIFTGLSFAVDPLCNSFLGLLLLSFMFGFGVACINPATLTAAKNLTEGESIAPILGYIAFASAIGRVISGSVSGWFYDQTGNYDVSFLIVAGVQFAAAVIQCAQITWEEAS